MTSRPLPDSLTEILASHGFDAIAFYGGQAAVVQQDLLSSAADEHTDDAAHGGAGCCSDCCAFTTAEANDARITGLRTCRAENGSASCADRQTPQSASFSRAAGSSVDLSDVVAPDDNPVLVECE